MKLYHYASPDSWEWIKNGGKYFGHKEPGLIPLKRLWKEYKPAFVQTAVFLLLEREPKKWLKNPYFHNLWSRLSRNTWSLLLEITVDNPEKYSVLDWWNMEWHLSMNSEYLKKYWRNIPKRYRISSREDAEKAYLESKISLEEYLRSNDIQESYSAPEVISTEYIPMKDISVSKFQPRLLDEKWKPIDRYAADKIRTIPELSWLIS